MSRLQRETNPTPGFSPGVLPQHQKTDGTFAVTGENNPLPARIYGPDGNPISSTNRLPVDAKLTGRNVLLQSATGVSVSAGSSLVAIPRTNAENISGLYVLVRSDSPHRYRVRVDHHRETSSTLSSFSGGTDALPSAERVYGVSGIIKPVGHRFAILFYNQDESDHIYDVEVRSE